MGEVKQVGDAKSHVTIHVAYSLALQERTSHATLSNVVCAQGRTGIHSNGRSLQASHKGAPAIMAACWRQILRLQVRWQPAW